MLTLALTDFQTELPFSVNIEAAKVTPFINESLLRDFSASFMPAATLESIRSQDAPGTVSEWPVTLTSVTLNQLVRRRDKVYKALTVSPTGDVPADGVNTTDWAYQQLPTAWLVYFRPAWVRAAYARFLVWHGFNVEKAGVTVPVDDREMTYARPSSGQAAQLQADANSSASTYANRLLEFLDDEKLLTDSTCTPARRRHKQSLWGV